MSDEPDKPDGKRSRAWIVVALLVLYPLSLGPTCFLLGTGRLGMRAIETIEVIYIPIGPIRQILPIRRGLQWYETTFFNLGRRFR